LNKTANFNSYAKEGFNDQDQIRLASFFKEMDRPGVYQILSNSDPRVTNPEDNFLDNLYKEYKISRVYAKRMINSDAEKRGNITEILVTNY
jgi:DNA adenine methylase